MLKDKSGSSEKSQVLGDGSSRLIDGWFKKENEIYDSDISKIKSISYMGGKDLTLEIKA